MSLTTIVGDVGSGKTLLTTMLASESEVNVYSNYNIKINRYRELTPQRLIDINEPALIIIDEAYAWLESRLSMRDLNRYLSYILFQSRKRELDFLITMQLLSSVDIRFRDMTTYLILAQNIPEGFQYTIVKNSMYRYRPKVMVLQFEDAKNIYPLYNSWQIIEPIDAELMSNVIAESSPEELNREVANMAREIITKNPNRKITKGTVKDYLVQTGKPLNHADYVYNRIKAILDSKGSVCNVKE